MRTTLAVRPRLSARISTSESRTEAFSRARFGDRGETAAIDLVLPREPSRHQRLLLETLLDLVLRMEPIVGEVRLSTEGEADPILSLLSDAMARIPLELLPSATSGLRTVEFGIGPGDCPYVDANDWALGFSASPPSGPAGFGAGSIFGALEAAKYLFLRAVAITHETHVDAVWPDGEAFDLARWTLTSKSGLATERRPAPGLRCPPLVLVGCGGVGAGYLWFLRKSGFSGTLVLIDDDVIEWHNMNRLLFATVKNADEGRKKITAAAKFMAGAWNVELVPQKAEHDESIAAMQRVVRAGGMLASAVGEPETRKFLARRGFPRFFDAATNSDGSAQVLALVGGTTTCIDCHVRSRPVAPAPGGCGIVQVRRFAGVVPHLSAYAGALLAFEQLRSLFDPPNTLAGANTQSIMRAIDATTREPTTRCAACPLAGSAPTAVTFRPTD